MPHSPTSPAASDPSPAWQEHCLFADTKLAWLVSHEPFVGAWRAWLCATELPTTSPATRTRAARPLTRDVVAVLAGCCRAAPEALLPEATAVPSGFGRDDAPYLPALLGLTGPATPQRVARFIQRRLGVEPDLAVAERVVRHGAASRGGGGHVHPNMPEFRTKYAGENRPLVFVIDRFDLAEFGAVLPGLTEPSSESSTPRSGTGRRRPPHPARPTPYWACSPTGGTS